MPTGKPDVFDFRSAYKQNTLEQQSPGQGSLESLAEIVQEHTRQLTLLWAEHEALKVDADNFKRIFSTTRGLDQCQSPLTPGSKLHSPLQSRGGTGARNSIRTQPDQLSRGVGKGQQRQRQSAPQALAFGAKVPMRTSDTATSSKAIVSKAGRSSVPSATGAVAVTARGSINGAQRGRGVISPGGLAPQKQRSRSSSSGGNTDECLESGDLPPRRRTLPSRIGNTRSSMSLEGGHDLYDCAQPLLEPTSSAKEQTFALQAVEAALKRGESPKSWQGPGTPLRTAVEARHVDFVRILLKARANPNECDERAVSVLHAAAFHGQQDLCNELLHAKANANAADQHGQTPLFFAPTRSICELLCACRADTHATNLKGQSAVHFAGQAALNDVLLWFATRVNRSVLDMHDVHGATAAYYARAAGVKLDVLHKLQQGEQTDASATVPARKSLPGRATETSQAADIGLDFGSMQLAAIGPGDSGGLPPLPEELDLDPVTLETEATTFRTCLSDEAETPASSSAASPMLNHFTYQDTAEQMAAVRLQAAARSYLVRKSMAREGFIGRGSRKEDQAIEPESVALHISDVAVSTPEANSKQSAGAGIQKATTRTRVLRRSQADSLGSSGSVSQKSVIIDEEDLPTLGIDDCCQTQQLLHTPPKNKSNPPRSLPGTPRRDRPQNERRSSTTSPPPVAPERATPGQMVHGRVQSARIVRTRNSTSGPTPAGAFGSQPNSPTTSPQQTRFQTANPRRSVPGAAPAGASPLRRSVTSKSPEAHRSQAPAVGRTASDLKVKK